RQTGAAGKAKQHHGSDSTNNPTPEDCLSIIFLSGFSIPTAFSKVFSALRRIPPPANLPS
ncbi:MAG: hypothetical protein PHW12_05375, partial [Smithella sp.]|nr:hypothetical protein [Smithella sp.]